MKLEDIDIAVNEVNQILITLDSTMHYHFQTEYRIGGDIDYSYKIWAVEGPSYHLTKLDKFSEVKRVLLMAESFRREHNSEEIEVIQGLLASRMMKNIMSMLLMGIGSPLVMMNPFIEDKGTHSEGMRLLDE